MGNRYIDYCQIKGNQQRVILFVSELAHVGQPPYGTVYQVPGKTSIKRVMRRYNGHDQLPTRDTFEQAQEDLDDYAIEKMLKRVSYCEQCGAEIITDPLDCNTNQRFCSTRCADLQQ